MMIEVRFSVPLHLDAEGKPFYATKYRCDYNIYVIIISAQIVDQGDLNLAYLRTILFCCDGLMPLSLIREILEASLIAFYMLLYLSQEDLKSAEATDAYDLE